MLNLASFVHTWMPQEADLLMRENMSKNLIGICFFPRLKGIESIRAYLDSDEYPATRTLIFDSIIAYIHFMRFRNNSYSLYVQSLYF